eukprot:9068903-Karenia_brevis.AAC.1
MDTLLQIVHRRAKAKVLRWRLLKKETNRTIVEERRQEKWKKFQEKIKRNKRQQEHEKSNESEDDEKGLSQEEANGDEENDEEGDAVGAGMAGDEEPHSPDCEEGREPKRVYGPPR